MQLNEVNSNKKKHWLVSFTSFEDLLILIGIILNIFSIVISFAYGHIIAGIMLVVCEILLILAYVIKLF